MNGQNKHSIEISSIIDAQSIFKTFFFISLKMKDIFLSIGIHLYHRNIFIEKKLHVAALDGDSKLLLFAVSGLPPTDAIARYLAAPSDGSPPSLLLGMNRCR